MDPDIAASQGRARTRLAVVGSDLKFITPLVNKLNDTGRFEVRIDEWPKFRVHDTTITNEVVAWADTIVCEWAGPNAVLASHQKSEHQRLVVRLHRVELSYDDWRDIDIDAVDAVVTVGPHYRRLVLETTGWPEEKVKLVSNGIDTTAFDRPKTEDARFHLGMIGAASARKRLDLALDVLARLRATDDRYQLFVKGSNPWEIKWVADRPEETAYFEGISERLEDPLIAGAVTFDPPGNDVAVWLENIGFVLSTSDDESFHLSPAEGMASRAIPVIRRWPGAEEIYDEPWLADDVDAMADRILSFREDVRLWTDTGEKARRAVVRDFDLDAVTGRWVDDILEPDGGRHRLRVSIVSDRNPYADPALMALTRSLDSVGHHVSVISRAEPMAGLSPRVTTTKVEAGGGRFSLGRLGRRLTGDKGAQQDALMVAALAGSRPHLIYPQRAEDITTANAAAAPTLRKPTWPVPLHDLVSLAPHDARLSTSPTTPLSYRELPTWVSGEPAPGRFQGHKAVLVYRVTPTSPGRYLESAMRRAGIEVTVMDAILDLDRVDPKAGFVVVVESAYPAFEVSGDKPDVPVFFWVHHGEHHLEANLRLTRRYRADAALMAHSWHLAHRFPVPTHRFPFGVAPELDPRSKSWGDREFDVAMVGSGIGSAGSRYRRRREIMEHIAAEFETKVAYGLRPEEMIALYGNSRIVVNDGGPKHFPITMRVFESLGGGSLLLTEDIPGTDTILRPGEHYVPMSDDPVDQVRTLLSDPGSALIAEKGHRSAMERHTYDHRVDRLVEIAANTSTTHDSRTPFPPLTPLARLIDQDVEVQHLAVYGETPALGLDDRAIRQIDSETLRETSIDAVVIGSGPLPDLPAAVLAARGYVYAGPEHAEAVADVLARHRPEAQVNTVDGLVRAVIGGMSYQARPSDHPLS